jgi:hypothetical protein
MDVNRLSGPDSLAIRAKKRFMRVLSRGIKVMKSIIAGVIFAALGISAAQAQADMSCADLLKANAQLDEKTKALAASDPTAAEMDRKVNDYCTKNPTAKASEAMEKAMQ